MVDTKNVDLNKDLPKRFLDQFYKESNDTYESKYGQIMVENFYEN
jgi:hypothetical protein